MTETPETMISLAAVVNTQLLGARASLAESVDSFAARVRHRTGYDTSLAEWDVRNALGVVLDGRTSLRGSGVVDGDAIYISPRPGEGA